MSTILALKRLYFLFKSPVNTVDFLRSLAVNTDMISVIRGPNSIASSGELQIFIHYRPGLYTVEAIHLSGVQRIVTWPGLGSKHVCKHNWKCTKFDQQGAPCECEILTTVCFRLYQERWRCKEVKIMFTHPTTVSRELLTTVIVLQELHC